MARLRHVLWPVLVRGGQQRAVRKDVGARGRNQPGEALPDGIGDAVTAADELGDDGEAGVDVAWCGGANHQEVHGTVLPQGDATPGRAARGTRAHPQDVERREVRPGPALEEEELLHVASLTRRARAKHQGL